MGCFAKTLSSAVVLVPEHGKGRMPKTIFCKSKLVKYLVLGRPLFTSRQKHVHVHIMLGTLFCCRDIVPLGQNKSNFNYSVDEKRVLNFENVVDDSDNVKQDMSIDVYGRKQDGDDEPEKGEADTKATKVCINSPCNKTSCATVPLFR